MVDNPLSKLDAALNPATFKIRRLWVASCRRLRPRVRFYTGSAAFRQLVEKAAATDTPPAVEAVLARGRRRRSQDLTGSTRTRSVALNPPRQTPAGSSVVSTSPVMAQTLLYRLTVLLQPKWVVELGTAFGVTSMAIAAGLGSGELDGIGYEQWKVDIAQQHVSDHRSMRAGLKTSSRLSTLDVWSPRHSRCVAHVQRHEDLRRLGPFQAGAWWSGGI